MTWPVEFGGGGRPPIERLIVAEEMISAGAPAGRVVVRRSADGPDAHGLRHARAGRRAPPPHPVRRDDVVHRDERARGRLRPRRAEDPRRARRRRLRHQRPEDLDQLRRGRRLLLPDLPHLDGGPTARRHQRDHRPDGHARHRGPAHQGHDDQPPLLRGLLHRRPRARRQPRRRRGRGVQADDAAAGARAGRHRPPGLQPRPLPHRARARADRDDPIVRQEIARLETGYRLGRLLVMREVLGQGPTGFSAATKCFCTEHEWEVARVRGPRARARGHAVGPARPGPDVRAGLHDHGRHLERDAQHPR